MSIKKFKDFINEGQFEPTEYRPQENTETEKRPDFAYMYNVNIFIDATSEDEAEKVLLDLQAQSNGKIELGFWQVELSPNKPELPSAVSTTNTETVEEGLVDSFKKVVGQLKEWKLDGTYFTKASTSAKDYLTKHPAAKQMIKSFMAKGLDQKQAEEAVLRVSDWGGKPNWNDVHFNTETKVLSLEPPKKLSVNPNPGGN